MNAGDQVARLRPDRQPQGEATAFAFAFAFAALHFYAAEMKIDDPTHQVQADAAADDQGKKACAAVHLEGPRVGDVENVRLTRQFPLQLAHLAQERR
jgi:hypothetical protein